LAISARKVCVPLVVFQLKVQVVVQVVVPAAVVALSMNKAALAVPMEM
jgi:hypothetical protein